MRNARSTTHNPWYSAMTLSASRWVFVIYPIKPSIDIVEFYIFIVIRLEILYCSEFACRLTNSCNYQMAQYIVRDAIEAYIIIDAIK